jgi:hypothetical protein
MEFVLMVCIGGPEPYLEHFGSITHYDFEVLVSIYQAVVIYRGPGLYHQQVCPGGIWGLKRFQKRGEDV